MINRRRFRFVRFIGFHLSLEEDGEEQTQLNSLPDRHLLVMSIDRNGKQGSGGKKTSTMKLQKVSSIVRELGDPCLHQSPLRVVVSVNQMLRPDKWQAAFDAEGKVSAFRKVLKLIRAGGVDPCIRPEVWEFLLGCYPLSSTAEYRNKLRAVRRDRYGELVKECQTMHASVGTGMLAFVVGSKVMDTRTYSKKIDKTEPEVEVVRASEVDSSRSNKINSNDGVDIFYPCQRESFSDSSDTVSVRGSADGSAYDSSLIPTPAEYVSNRLKAENEDCNSQFTVEKLFDFPALPVTNLFQKNDEVDEERESCDSKHTAQNQPSSSDHSMHSFEINNNEDLVKESKRSFCDTALHDFNSEIVTDNSNGHVATLQSNTFGQNNKEISRQRTSGAPDTQGTHASTSLGVPGADKVSEWRWTLHRIVVDVVRTDSHLEFYEDPKNLARMSDILAVYAWIDPQTGYCQGMSDLLSPFVVLFEDDADAFWCFEMLLRRVRDNFRMEGSTGVMKQLLTLWHILELIDREIFSHLSRIGAESLHFAFRMLHVLFRRELSFNEALCMWEMMWAADFDESLAVNLEQDCLEPLFLQLPRESCSDTGEESVENDDSVKGGSQGKQCSVEQSVSEDDGIKSVAPNISFCGLTKGFWSRNGCINSRSGSFSSRIGEDELPVFCVAAVLILNRHKIVKETRSMDDLIKIFNDNVLKINVRRCIRTAVKLRKKFFYKMMKNNGVVDWGASME
ncbi:hypothetical protein V2J09_024128 [Rumex salicifolius]